MGQEIDTGRFTEQDFQRFSDRLTEETALLHDWIERGRFGAKDRAAGFELEAWLVDRNGNPAPLNDVCIRALASDLFSPELAQFNIELNTHSFALGGPVFSELHRELARTWARLDEVVSEYDASPLMIGILPTVRESDLTLANMSPLNRYHALNEQVLSLRSGRPLKLDIVGIERLTTEQYSVMLESATTSLQVHTQVPMNEAVRYCNAAIIASAPCVALAANSPFLFGRNLWDETRIPLFEQSVETGGYHGAAQGPLRRAGFGSGYLRSSVMEWFRENLDHYPILLPIRFSEDDTELSTLRLHNGTIWRWNRPLVGFSKDGEPHFRLEHRVMAAGPSLIDVIANNAFFHGLVHDLAQQDNPPESQLEFATARDNYYHAARLGLNATVQWLDGERRDLQHLILDQLLPQAQTGLAALGVDRKDADDTLGIIDARVRSGQNGAAWQRAYVSEHGPDMNRLTCAYLAHQRNGQPVHEWPV